MFRTIGLSGEKKTGSSALASTSKSMASGPLMKMGTEELGESWIELSSNTTSQSTIGGLGSVGSVVYSGNSSNAAIPSATATTSTTAAVPSSSSGSQLLVSLTPPELNVRSPERTTPLPFASVEEYIRLLREAQRESKESSRVASLTSSRKNSPRGSPKSPPNSPNTELAATEEDLKNVYINYLNKDGDIVKDTDWVWDWSSRPDQQPPNDDDVDVVRPTDGGKFAEQGVVASALDWRLNKPDEAAATNKTDTWKEGFSRAIIGESEKSNFIDRKSEDMPTTVWPRLVGRRPPQPVDENQPTTPQQQQQDDDHHDINDGGNDNDDDDDDDDDDDEDDGDDENEHLNESHRRNLRIELDGPEIIRSGKSIKVNPACAAGSSGPDPEQIFFCQSGRTSSKIRLPSGYCEWRSLSLYKFVSSELCGSKGCFKMQTALILPEDSRQSVRNNPLRSVPRPHHRKMPHNGVQQIE
uniref:Putative pheromone-processing carboxypeptidase kex1 n=1 Tax=Anopheles darlingi TaxID=43151 RepID=A0A2M4CPP3_ANODA